MEIDDLAPVYDGRLSPPVCTPVRVVQMSGAVVGQVAREPVRRGSKRTSRPFFEPTSEPFAPGNLPKRWSKLRSP
jgi:hypothetical protein